MRGDIVTKMIKAWGHSASYQSRDTRMATEDSDETGSGDDLPQSSIDWLILHEQTASTNQGEDHEYLVDDEDIQETMDFDYTATYRRSPEMMGLSGEQQLLEDPGEMMQKMREIIITINYRRAVPLTHYLPEEEPAKKEPKQGPTLFEAQRIDQAILDLDQFL